MSWSRKNRREAAYFPFATSEVANAGDETASINWRGVEKRAGICYKIYRILAQLRGITRWHSDCKFPSHMLIRGWHRTELSYGGLAK
jgi:hypothetical protein